MWNVLLFIHIVVSLLLITFILLQKSNSDGLSGISSSNTMGGVVSSRTAADFMTKTTITLTVLFFINSLVLANLSSKKSESIFNKIESSTESNPINNDTKDTTTVPIAK